MLWAHTIGLETSEVTRYLKDDSEEIFYEQLGKLKVNKHVEQLPRVSGQGIIEHYLLVPDLIFDLETKELAKSTSMAAILKTI